MKILFFSDVHGDPTSMKLLFERNEELKADKFVFLGDALYHGPRNTLPAAYNCMETVEYFNSIRENILAVRGNCDTSAVLGDGLVKATDEINSLGKKIVFTHGNLYGAKSSLDSLIYLARERAADVILFGHTHSPLEKYISDFELYLFNPGSIGAGSYGVINITDSGILFSHGRV